MSRHPSAAEPASSVELEQRCSAALAEWSVDPSTAPLVIEAVMADAVAGLHVEDRCLAHACALGDARALRVFESTFGEDLDRIRGRFREHQMDAAEFRQLVLTAIFVPRADRPAKIRAYSGRGSLRAWVRTVAARAILDGKRQRKRRSEAELFSEDVAAPETRESDPEFDFLLRRCQTEFRAAVADAAQSLSREERLVLRLSVCERMSIDHIGKVLGIHRANAARRINRARETLRQRTRALLRERLRMSPTELDSMMRYLQSHLHVTLDRCLATMNAVPPVG